jgi:hypothetical protein
MVDDVFLVILGLNICQYVVVNSVLSYEDLISSNAQL